MGLQSARTSCHIDRGRLHGVDRRACRQLETAVVVERAHRRYKAGVGRDRRPNDLAGQAPDRT